MRIRQQRRKSRRSPNDRAGQQWNEPDKVPADGLGPLQVIPVFDRPTGLTAMEDQGSPAVQLLPAPPTQLKEVDGYRGLVEDCLACHRDFWVLVPSVKMGPALTLEVPCPHCHATRNEVAMTASERPVFVQGIQRPWISWQWREVRRLSRAAWAGLRIASYRTLWRTKSLVGLPKAAEGPSGRSPK